MLGRAREQVRGSPAASPLAGAREVVSLGDLFGRPRPERALGRNPGDDKRHAVVKPADDPELRECQRPEWTRAGSGYDVEAGVERARASLDESVAGKGRLPGLVATKN
jgi:hypothetical protein